MCNPVTIFMPAVRREHQPSWRGFAAAACACTAAAVSTQMFLCPFPKCSSVDISPVETKALVLILLDTLQPLFFKCVLMLPGEPQPPRMGGRIQGLDQTQETVQQDRTEGSSPSAQAGTVSELQGLPWENGGCSPTEVTLRAMHGPRGHVAARFPGLPELFRELGGWDAFLPPFVS